MSSAKADLKILGYLGRGLSLELSAVQLYSTQARLAETWGLTEVAGKFSAEAREELGHADRIISQMLSFGVAPNASQLRPVKLGQNLLELLQADFAFENELVNLYADATRYCAHIGDRDTRNFFEALLKEEQEHAADLQKWIQELQVTDSKANLNIG